MKKWPQVNISAHLDGQRFDSAKAIPGLDERLHCLREQIPDLSRLECRPASTEPVYRIMLEARETHLEILTSAAYGLARHIQNQLGCSEALVEILNCVSGGRIPPSSVPCFPE